MENLLTKPNEMDFDATNLAVAWKKWKQTMMLFMQAVMNSKSEKEKYSTFLYVIGQRGRDIFNTWKCDRENITVEMLFEKFEEYCLPKRNLLLERRRFFMKNQQDETIDIYLTELRNLAATCEFGALHDELILYKIVDGIKSQSTTEKLLRKGSELTLEKALNICRAEELTKQQMLIVNEGKEDSIKRGPGRSISFEGLDKYSHFDDEEEDDDDFVSSGSILVMNQGRRGSSRLSSIARGDISTHDECSDAGFDNTSASHTTCRRSGAGSVCGSERSLHSCRRRTNSTVSCNHCTRHQRNKCTPCGGGGQECRKCRKRFEGARSSTASCCNSCLNDSSSTCRNTDTETYTTHRTKVPVVTYSDQTEEFYTHDPSDHEVEKHTRTCLTRHPHDDEKYQYATQTEVMFVLRINDKLVRAQMGTMAELDVMPKRVYDLVADKDATLNEIPMEYNPGDDITVYGSTEMLCSYKDKSVTVNFYVMETDTITMLTMNTCHELGMI